MTGHAGQARLSFPNEIWWLVAQEFAAQRDFGGLFLCARLSRTLAGLALPSLYAIHHEAARVFDPHSINRKTFVCLWRAIIASGLGKTLFPYCFWIKALKLGNLYSHLEALAHNNRRLKARFFSRPLEKLLIVRGRGRHRTLDVKAIIVKVAKLVTERIRILASQEDRRVGITSLEVSYLPTPNLSKWLSDFSSLESLSVHDGFVLNSDVASTLRANCPRFRNV